MCFYVQLSLILSWFLTFWFQPGCPCVSVCIWVLLGTVTDIFSMRTLNKVFVCLQPLSRSAVVDEESCADQVRPSASAAWRLAASRWGGRTLRSLLDQHPPRGHWAPRKRLRAEMNVVSSQRFTDVETDSGSKYIYGRQWMKVQLHSGNGRFLAIWT